jgi:hypothetical protein
VALSDWSMCHAFISPPVFHLYLYGCATWMPNVPSILLYVCHIIYTNDTWHFFIGPHGAPKIPFLGDMWQPVVFPHHHADINMMSYVICMKFTIMIHGSLWDCHVAPPLTFDMFDHNFDRP